MRYVAPCGGGGGSTRGFFGGGAAATNQPLGELQALLGQTRGGQAPQGGMLQMPDEMQPLAQRPSDAAEPMILWGDDEPTTSQQQQDTWFL